MYASPNANLNGSAENNMEEFLLGKKNVDELLRAKQRQEIVSWHGMWRGCALLTAPIASSYRGRGEQIHTFQLQCKQRA